MGLKKRLKKQRQIEEAQIEETFGQEETFFEKIEEETLKLEAEKEIDAGKYIEERCEFISDADKQMKGIQTEYQEVSLYLTDTQIIERIPLENREELDDAARHILALAKERERIRTKGSSLTEEQYKTMERYELDIPKVIPRLKEEEKRAVDIKNDLKQLEGEKGAIQYEKEELLRRREMMNRTGLIAGVMVPSLFLLYLVLYLSMQADIMIPFLLTVLGSAVLAAYLFFEARRTVSQLKMCDKKWNKAVSLQNKVKIKYINNTAALDYSYDKYGVNHSKELSFRYEQFIREKEEGNLYRQNTEALNFYNDQMVEILAHLGLHDPEIWIHQADAILDRKEMVEIRHRLNTRRQKLRDRLEYNRKLKEKSEEELRTFQKGHPTQQDLLTGCLAKYQISL